MRVTQLETQNALLQRRAQELQEQVAAMQKSGWQAARAAEDHAAQARRAEAEKAELQQRIDLLHMQLGERCGPSARQQCTGRAPSAMLSPRPHRVPQYL